MMANLRPGYRAPNSKSIGNPFLETDNAGNMIRMRELVSAGRDIVQYGCSAHQLNLLAKDLASTRVTNSIVEITKFFGNTHLPKSWLKDEGAKKPPMPCTLRWSSSLRLLEWYSEEWVKIKRVIDKHLEYFSSSAHSAIVRNVKNLTLFQQVTDAIKCLTPICVALNQIQDNSIQVAQAVEALKDLLEKFRGNTDFREWLENCQARYNVSVPDVWFVANLLHPKLIGNRLTQFELQKAVSWIKENKPGELTAFLNYIGVKRRNR